MMSTPFNTQHGQRGQFSMRCAHPGLISNLRAHPGTTLDFTLVVGSDRLVVNLISIFMASFLKLY